MLKLDLGTTTIIFYQGQYFVMDREEDDCYIVNETQKLLKPYARKCTVEELQAKLDGIPLTHLLVRI